MNKAKEHWIEEALNSLDGVRAVPPEYLQERIRLKLSWPVARVISLKTAFAAAASLALLITINILLVSNSRQPIVTNQHEVQTIQSAYSTIPY